MILQVAIDTPLRQVFDYLPPSTQGKEFSPLGVRVLVPFGRQRLIGILVGIVAESAVPAAKLKSALEFLDETPVYDPVTFELLRWAAEYYHHPIGEVYAAALPVSLRDGQPASASVETWSLTEAGSEELVHPSSRRAPQQRALLSWLAEHSGASTAEVTESFKPAHLKTLEARGWVVPHLSHLTGLSLAGDLGSVEVHPGGLALTGAQSQAVETIIAALPAFSVHLLYGVTGSGKTEVYLQVIAASLAQGGQALVLVPEIALTPQLVDRFRRRFSGGVAVVHSALTDSERRDAWRAAHSGRARIIIGTRSAVFTSMPKLALIVVDEEHDASYKQHEGFRYSARDLSVMRARGAGVPVILGSATPSLETLENAAGGRYVKHILPQRPGAAQPPRMSLVDLRRHAADQGLSTPAMQAIDQHLKAGGQVIVFLNRRGYAPSLFCNSLCALRCAHDLAPPGAQAALSSLRCAGTGADDLRELRSGIVARGPGYGTGRGDLDAPVP
jgi:primosomal protein N' (replication factor Y)